MLEVTAIGSHTGKHLVKFAFLISFCGSFSQRAKLLLTHQSSWVLAEFMVLFQHGIPDVLWVQI